MYQYKDPFYQKAQKEGYRSRAAYKLLELNRSFNLLHQGDFVVDLGCWPGGWLQVASRLVGNKGKAVGVDLKPLKPLSERNVEALQGDVRSPDLQDRILKLLGRRADVVLSDMAPKLSGIPERDKAQTLELCRTALAFACKLLKPGGSLLVKLFMGKEAQEFLAEVRPLFHKVQTTRPKATRKGSAEVYVVAKGLIPPPESSSPPIRCSAEPSVPRSGPHGPWPQPPPPKNKPAQQEASQKPPP